MNVLFLMDPLDGVIPEKDTSLALMVGAHRQGHATYFLPDGGLTLTHAGASFAVERVVPRLDADEPFLRKERVLLTQDDVDLVFIRTDPPFDSTYLMNMWLLERLPARIPIINSPGGIRTVNEKVWALQFADLIPATMVSRRLDDLAGFLAQEQDVIAKPTDGFGGQSVFHLHAGDTNAAVTLETLTHNGSREIILQRYVPAAQQGDKRILLLNGEILGAVLRVHVEGEHRNNFFSGGQPVGTEITAREHEIVARLAPALVELGLTFVGLDVIGDHLIEVNVTSPTCLQEMNRIYGKQLEDDVIAFAERLVGGRSR